MEKILDWNRDWNEIISLIDLPEEVDKQSLLLSTIITVSMC